jgi:glycosyltransferase involved in cell wall biosynthesis
MNPEKPNLEISPELSILMPVYNELENIGAILDKVAVSLPGVNKQIIIVDDGSKDGTRSWLKERFPATIDDSRNSPAANDSKLNEECTVRVIFHSRNLGKGGAIQTAMRAATGAIVVIQDADLEYDPDDWLVMYSLIATKKVADVVYGSRFYGMPHRSLFFHHYLANRLISLIFNILCNQTLTDVETCYKMFTREVLQTLKLTANDFGIEIQLSTQIALGSRWRIYETGIHYYGRTYQEGKKINWKDGLKALWYLIRYRIAPGN